MVERQEDGRRFYADIVDVDAMHGATMCNEVLRAISRDAWTEWKRRMLEILID